MKRKLQTVLATGDDGSPPCEPLFKNADKLLKAVVTRAEADPLYARSLLEAAAQLANPKDVVDVTARLVGYDKALRGQLFKKIKGAGDGKKGRAKVSIALKLEMAHHYAILTGQNHNLKPGKAREVMADRWKTLSVSRIRALVTEGEKIGRKLGMLEFQIKASSNF